MQQSYWLKQSETQPWQVMQKLCEHIMSIDSNLFEATYRLYFQENYLRLKKSWLFQRYADETIYFMGLFADNKKGRAESLNRLMAEIYKNDWPLAEKTEVLNDIYYFLQSPEYKYYLLVAEDILTTDKKEKFLQQLQKYRKQYIGNSLEHFFIKLEEAAKKLPSRKNRLGESMASAVSIINTLKHMEG